MYIHAKRPQVTNSAANQHPPTTFLRDPKYHLIEAIRLLTEVHWGVLEGIAVGVLS